MLRVCATVLLIAFSAAAQLSHRSSTTRTGFRARIPRPDEGLLMHCNVTGRPVKGSDKQGEASYDLRPTQGRASLAGVLPQTPHKSHVSGKALSCLQDLTLQPKSQRQ